MATPQPIVLTDYATAPRLSVSSAVSLGIALLTVVPKPTPQGVRIAATRLRTTVVDLQHEWNRELDAGAADTLPRDADVRVDRAIRSTSMRLEAYALLAPEHVPEAARAKTAQGRLFPQGLRFLNLPYEEQWAHGQRLLEAIDRDAQLAADVEELVGEAIFAELQAAQKAYGDALGITAVRVTPAAIPLLDRLAAVRAAIVGYALQIIAMQDVDANRIPDARKALGPIDERRAREARRATAPARGNGPGNEATGEPEEDAMVTPTTPVPSVEETGDDLAASGS
jgi:hypothetical protein